VRRPAGCHRGKGCSVVATPDRCDYKLDAERRRRLLNSLQLLAGSGAGIVGKQQADTCRPGNRLPEKLQLLGRQRALGRDEYACDICARFRQARNQTECHRVAVREQHDWDRRGCALGSLGCHRADGKDHVGAAYKILRHRWQPFELALRISAHDDEIAALDVAELGKRCRNPIREVRVGIDAGSGVQDA
jgi:hypothetical protein